MTRAGRPRRTMGTTWFAALIVSKSSSAVELLAGASSSGTRPHSWNFRSSFDSTFAGT